jgi:hypothetical protein
MTNLFSHLTRLSHQTLLRQPYPIHTSSISTREREQRTTRTKLSKSQNNTNRQQQTCRHSQRISTMSVNALAIAEDESKPMSPQKAYRKRMEKMLRHVREKLNDHVDNCMTIENDELDAFNVKLGDDISLQPDAIDFGPRFSKPFPASRLRELQKARWFDDEQPGRFPESCETLDGLYLSKYFEEYHGHYKYPWTFAASSPWNVIQ